MPPKSLAKLAMAKKKSEKPEKNVEKRKSKFTKTKSNFDPNDFSTEDYEDSDDEMDDEGCCPSDMNLSHEGPDEKFLEEVAPPNYIPTFLKFIICAAFWSGYIYYMHFMETNVMADNERMETFMSWYMLAFENISSVCGVGMGGLMLFSLMRQLFAKDKGGEFM